ncbi:MAG: protein methyltransferase [Thermoprotei archaeon]|nr:MAG: protein methyltransferase [Thermoprotei archaeon]
MICMAGLGYGDRVTVYIDSKRRFVVRVSPGGILGTDKGYVKHEDLVGKEYGDSIVTSQKCRAYLLKPLPIDYQHGIDRVTQIVYPKDAAFMIYLAGITPGSHVLEAGVGSGFLTISLATFIGSTGKVYGFDINQHHLEVARRNLEKAGLLDRVYLGLRDIRKGVKLVGLDAVFYDLPDPWNALKTAYNVLKNGSPILVYVPTVNQVERTVLAMRELGGFVDIHVYELLLREYEVGKDATRPRTAMIGHTGYIVFARKIK